MSSSDTLYAKITDQIIEMLEAPTSNDFELPWHQSGGLALPLNAATGRPYHGVNVLVLWARGLAAGYTSGRFATYRQWASLGAQVRRGEKAVTIVFYKGQPATAVGGQDPASEVSGKSEHHAGSRLVARASAVFAAEQVEGFTPPAPPQRNKAQVLASAAEFIAATRATFLYGGDRAFYRPSTDTIHLPPVSAFTGSRASTPPEALYNTIFHELAHWTSPKDRCGRELGTRFGDAAYCVEELIAELASAFLCADLNVAPAPRPDHAHYLAHWLTILRADKRAIFTAASKAAQAAAYLHGLQPDASNHEVPSVAIGQPEPLSHIGVAQSGLGATAWFGAAG